MANVPAATKSAASTKDVAPKIVSTAVAAAEAGKEKYATMIVGIGKSHEADHANLLKKADEIGVKVGHLVWHLIIAGLANVKPGDVAVAAGGSRVGSVGTAPGFWIVPTQEDGKTTGVKVVEVGKRSDVSGREFYRYTVDADDKAATAKNRDRARNQAIRGAKSDLSFLGVKGEVQVINLAAKPVG